MIDSQGLQLYFLPTQRWSKIGSTASYVYAIFRSYL